MKVIVYYVIGVYHILLLALVIQNLRQSVENHRDGMAGRTAIMDAETRTMKTMLDFESRTVERWALLKERNKGLVVPNVVEPTEGPHIGPGEDALR